MAKKRRARPRRPDPAAPVLNQLAGKAGDDGHALLTAIDLCVRTGRPVPPPFAQLFCDRLDEWFRHQAASLDQVFGVQRPKGQHLADLKKRTRLRPIVVTRVLELHAQGLAIDTVLLTRVAGELGISLSTVNRLYYDREGRALRSILRKASFSI
jgi:hypothetical protein